MTFDPPRTLRRSTSDSMIGGVAGGLGEFFGIDPTAVRVIWIIGLVAGGTGLLLYLLLWAVVPDDQGGVAALPRAILAVLLLFAVVGLCCGLTGAMLAIGQN
jgi:phage shock protein PspC (stress-responsive transcriptional regulator)